jgi:hypothetical protein
MGSTFSSLVASVANPGASPFEDRTGERVSDDAVARRKSAAVIAGGRVPFNRQGPNPKQAFRVVLCRLLTDPADRVALDYIPVGLGFRSKGDTFGKSALSRIYCQFKEILPEHIREQIFEEVTTYEGWLTGGTENHIAMRRTAGFLFGEAFPDASFAHGLKGAELAEVCLDYMKGYGKLLYRNSMIEFLSPIYHACHTATWINVYDFATDPDAKLCARAILDHMFADLAANSHHGIIIPPAARAKGLMTDSYQLSTVRSNTQWSSWLYWGAGNVEETVEAIDTTDTWKKSPFTLHAVSDYVPESVIRHLGAKRFVSPYSLLQARANREVIDPPSVNAYGKTEPVQRNSPNARYVSRSVYVNEDYAIGAGARVSDIDEPTVRHAHTFGVIWKDDAPRNWLFFVHPYWYVNRLHDDTGEPLGVDDWSGTSPFLQMVHWENSAVLLLDLPEQDPYHGQAVGSNPKWISDRPKKLYQRVNAYVPETIEESLDIDGGVYLRSGTVYVGLRPAGGQFEWETCEREGYRRLALKGETIAVAVEVGDKKEYGSFQAFVESCKSTELDGRLLAAEKRVRYTTTRGHRLELQHRGRDWRPNASVNDVPLDWESWPICESPYLTCRDGVMDVNDGRNGFKVDWQGDLPKYDYYTKEAI